MTIFISIRAQNVEKFQLLFAALILQKFRKDTRLDVLQKVVGLIKACMDRQRHLRLSNGIISHAKLHAPKHQAKVWYIRDFFTSLNGRR